MNIKTANRLCELRKKHNLSQEELATKLGVSRQAVSKWERSESSPDTDNLIELAKLYNITLDNLLNGDEAIDLINENKESDEYERQNNKEASDRENEGFIISDDENNTVHISKDGIFLKDGNTDEYVEIKKSGIYVNDERKEFNKNKRQTKHPVGEAVKDAISGGYTVAAIGTYMTLGFLLDNGAGWKYFWFLFILIPVVSSICEMFYKKKITAFCYPVAVTAAYCGFSMYFGIWHPLWLLFLTIPLFYIIFGPIDKAIEKRNKKML